MIEQAGIPLHQMVVGRYNPRRKINPRKFKELKDGIREQGILQSILLRPITGGDKPYEVVAGQRRYLAALEVFGANYVPPQLVREMTDDEAERAAAAENTQRDDMSPVEEAEAAARELAKCGGDRKEVSKRMGWSLSTLDGYLKLMACSPLVRKAVDDETIPLGLGELLAGLPYAKQDDVLTQLLASGKLPPLEQVKSQIMALSKSMAAPIFDKEECGSCQHNSALQKAMFGTFEDGHCLNAACYDKKTEDVLQGTVAKLKEDFNRIDIVRAGDNFRVIPIQPAAIGEEQAVACRQCNNYGAAVSALPNKLGQVKTNLCYDPNCNEEKVAAYKKSQADLEAAAVGANATAAATPSDNATSAPASTSTPTKKGATSASKTGGEKEAAAAKAPTVELSNALHEFRDKLYRSVLHKELAIHPERSMQFIYALILSGKGSYFDSGVLEDALEKMGGKPETSTAHDLPGSLAFILKMPAELLANALPKLGITALTKLTRPEMTALCKQLKPDFSQYFALNTDTGREFLETLTKSGITAVCNELGIAEKMGKTFQSVASAKKDEFIKQVTSINDFTYQGKIPKAILPGFAK